MLLSTEENHISNRKFSKSPKKKKKKPTIIGIFSLIQKVSHNHPNLNPNPNPKIRKGRDTWPLTLRLMWAAWSLGFLSSSWFVTPDILLEPKSSRLSDVCLRFNAWTLLPSLFLSLLSLSSLSPFPFLLSPFFKRGKGVCNMNGSNLIGWMLIWRRNWAETRACFIHSVRRRIISPFIGPIKICTVPFGSLTSFNVSWANQQNKFSQ